ncbi:non-specific lipid-transfer protein 8-like [Canna indica]|uniref:Non-specific lipid-transfer protein n=1 Tax=Canna indica TaxID=4628 RepID=A0AAQ3KYX7_9LILI|nr:non-specific lipid-transfer protein 8-like [Canna indica]
MKLQTIARAATILLLLLLPATEAAIQCSSVVRDLAPCVSYLGSTGSGTPPSACCRGLSSLVAAASTTADRRAVCSCILSAAATINLNPAAAQALPSSCGVSLPFTISPNVDCTKIG